MKPNNRTFLRLKWQIFAGYLFPMLTCWFLLAWVLGFTYWWIIGDAPKSEKWVGIPLFTFIIVSWLTFIPTSGYAMGIVNAFCWKPLRLSDASKAKGATGVILLVWLFSYTGMFLFARSRFNVVTNLQAGFLFGTIWILPIHVACMLKGQKRGEKWIETDAAYKFLGRKNDWERDEKN